MGWSIGGKINIGFGVALGFMVIIGVVSHHSARQLMETVRLETHTHKVLNELHDVLMQLQRAETGQRGYILTGEDGYLAPYKKGLAAIETELAALRRLTADNPDQQRRLDRLEPLVDAKFAELEQTISLHDSAGFEAAVAVVRSGYGKRLMDDMRRLIEAMESEEESLLQVRAARAETTEQRMTLVITAGSVLAFGFVMFAGVGIHRDITHRRRAEAALERAHAELEERVALRTSELSHANTELKKEIAWRKSVEERLRKSYDDMLSVLDGLQVGTVVVDREGRVRFLSRVAQNLCGRHGDDALGLLWTELLPFSDADRSRLAEMLRAPPQDRARVSLYVETSRGRYYWMEIDVRDDPHEPSRRIFFIYDVTEVADLRQRLDKTTRFRGMVGKSEPMRQIYAQIQAVAAVDSTVLIEGETGTGKELAARAVHHFSHRAHAPFIAVNCAGLTESLLGSQLFGHSKGAFTGAVDDHQGVFEAADGGTIFLDEIGDVPPSMQSSLLRVLEEKEITRLGESWPRAVDVRVITATHHDLAADVAHHRFRADLLYRIRVARLRLPPLRERRDDIPLLVSYFLGQFRSTTGKAVEDVGNEVMRILVEHTWPGNVRELRNAVEYAVIRASGPVLQVADLPPELGGLRRMEPAPGQAPTDGEAWEELSAALEMAGGNRTSAARLLGISRATLYRRLASLKELNGDQG